METSEILKSFCERIGIKYEPNADGACSFEADGLLVTVSDLRGLDQIALVGDLGEPPPQRLERLYKTMLEGNHLLGATGGATLSLDPDTGRFALCQFLPYRAIDADSLYSVADRFVSTIEAWTKLIGDFRDVLPLADKAAGGHDSGGLQMNGFMQV